MRSLNDDSKIKVVKEGCDADLVPTPRRGACRPGGWLSPRDGSRTYGQLSEAVQRKPVQNTFDASAPRSSVGTIPVRFRSFLNDSVAAAGQLRTRYLAAAACI